MIVLVLVVRNEASNELLLLSQRYPDIMHHGPRSSSSAFQCVGSFKFQSLPHSAAPTDEQRLSQSNKAFQVLSLLELVSRGYPHHVVRRRPRRSRALTVSSLASSALKRRLSSSSSPQSVFELSN